MPYVMRCNSFLTLRGTQLSLKQKQRSYCTEGAESGIYKMHNGKIARQFMNVRYGEHKMLWVKKGYKSSSCRILKLMEPRRKLMREG